MEFEVLRLSEHIKERLLFSKLVSETYNLIDFISKDYEHLSEWYWSKAVPWIFLHQTEFFIAISNNNIIGILIAKKEKSEKKICTLFVKPEYSGKGVGSFLIKSSFDYLGTTKPIITFCDYKLPEFEPIIKKFNWKIDDKKFKPYNNHFELKCNTNCY